jgi:hypothetical protein
MLPVRVEHDALQFGEHFQISFQRTVRVPEQDQAFPLPPTFGRFPVLPLTPTGRLAVRSLPDPDFLNVAIPMRPYEALWIGFDDPTGQPHAVKVGAGTINVLSGGAWDDTFRKDPQDYLVCPDQPWLDGINVGEGFVRQFVATSLSGPSLERQLGAVVSGGLRFLVAPPRADRIAEFDRGRRIDIPSPAMSRPASQRDLLAVGPGGKVGQRIYPDPYGWDVWDLGNLGRAAVHLLDAAQFHALTGMEAPPTPIDAETYARLGLPWFEVYDATRGDLPPAPGFDVLRPVGELSGEGHNTTSAGEKACAGLDPESLRVKRLAGGKRVGEE